MNLIYIGTWFNLSGIPNIFIPSNHLNLVKLLSFRWVLWIRLESVKTLFLFSTLLTVWSLMINHQASQHLYRFSHLTIYFLWLYKLEVS